MTERDASNPSAPARPTPEGEAPFTSAQTDDVAAHIDDPCDEGGYDQFCRDRNGELCRFHQEHCHAPDYPCLDLLRHHLAVVFLEDVTARRRARRALEQGGPSND
jgi:hypothetical protein